MILPLEDILVVAVEPYRAGPFGTLYRADLGATVIKIENPRSGGDRSRSVGPHFLGKLDSRFFQTFNRDKQSLTVLLKPPKGQEIFRKLVASADAAANNLRGDQLDKLAPTYEALREVNGKIVRAHFSTYGRSGSRVNWPGYDYLMRAEAGLPSLTGEPDSPPTRFGLSMIDYMSGVTMAFAPGAALLAAYRIGVGRDVDESVRCGTLSTHPSGDLLSEPRDRSPAGDPARAIRPPCPVNPFRRPAGGISSCVSPGNSGNCSPSESAGGVFLQVPFGVRCGETGNPKKTFHDRMSYTVDRRGL